MEGNFAIELLSWSMDRALASHSVSRINVANSNVEGFSPITISFEQQLQSLRGASEIGSIEIQFGSIRQSMDQMMENNTSRLNGEVVQVDSEVTSMVKHSGYYQTLADIMSRKMGLMKLAISSKG